MRKYRAINRAIRITLTILLLSASLPLAAVAQKVVHIPAEWDDRGIPYSMERSYESDNFIIFWGEKAGTNPQTAPEAIRFNPATTASLLEDIFRDFETDICMIPPDHGNYSIYKFIIVINDTWNTLPDGSQVFTGWAFGGSYDATIGAMWIHPKALDRFTLAHEFTHCMQNMIWIDYPGHGFINNDYVGSFWETHANYMALLVNPDRVENTDPARFLNTQHFFYSSARHHYTNWMFLQYINETEGIEFINRMWRESNIGEHPLQTLKRLKGIGQDALNDIFIHYAMRTVTFDFSNGDEIRHTMAAEVDSRFVARRFTIPAAISPENGRYTVPKHRAPQDYGYNIVKIVPDEGSDSLEITFRIHDNSRAGGGGTRTAFVFVNGMGIPRYSQVYRNDFEAVVNFDGADEDIYMVVSGAPDQHHNYVWEPGFPRIYRFPWEFRMVGAKPHGYQANPNSEHKGVPGYVHFNGGGFVANTASVSTQAFVGKDAVVKGYAVVDGNARIEDCAVISDNAHITGNAVVGGFAMVGGNASVSEEAKIGDYARVNDGANISGFARVEGSATVFHSSVSGIAKIRDNASLWGANLSGSIVLGGDAEHFGTCNAGEYLQIFDLGGRGCDGKTSHYLNVDINAEYTLFSDEEMGVTGLPRDLEAGTCPYSLSRLPGGVIRIDAPEGAGVSVTRVSAINLRGQVVSDRLTGSFSKTVELRIPEKGVMIIRIESGDSVYITKVVL